jgi:hypothetical protein
MRYGIQAPEKQVVFKCTPELHADIADACRRLEVDRSVFLRRAARKYIKEIQQTLDPVAPPNNQVRSVTPVTPRQQQTSASQDADLEFLTKADPAYVSYLENSDFNVHARRNLAAERVKTLRSQSGSKQTERVVAEQPAPPRPTFDPSSCEGNSTVDPFMGKAR